MVMPAEAGLQEKQARMDSRVCQMANARDDKDGRTAAVRKWLQPNKEYARAHFLMNDLMMSLDCQARIRQLAAARHDRFGATSDPRAELSIS